MLTQKKIKSELPSGEFDTSVIKWLAENATKLETSFSKKYPRSTNHFNVELRNKNGSRRTIILNGSGELKVDKNNSYKNIVTWQTARRLGCPSN